MEKNSDNRDPVALAYPFTSLSKGCNGGYFFRYRHPDEGEIEFFTGSSGSGYIADRFIPIGEIDPRTASSWDKYPILNFDRIPPLKIEHKKMAIVATNAGSIEFSFKHACGRLHFYGLDYPVISIERTPHIYARFYDFNRLFESVVDTTRTIY